MNQGIFPVILLQQVRIALNCTSLSLLNSSSKGDGRFPLKDSFTLCKLDFMLLTETSFNSMSYTIHWYFRAKSDGLVISKKWFVFRWNHKSTAVLMPGLMWRCAKRSRGRTCWSSRLVSHRIFLILMPFLALVMSERGLSRLSTCGIFERWHVDSGLCVYTVMYVFYG